MGSAVHNLMVMTTAIQREFLGWDQPLLETAAEWLFRRFGLAEHSPSFALRVSEDEWDLGRVVVVVPGRRAGRRLLELLVLRAEAAGRRLIPPAIETLGVLPERLYLLQRPLANDLVQQLTWTRALRTIERSVLERIAPRPPADDDVAAWWGLAKLLQAQHRELAADGLDFADVVTRGNEVPRFGEAARWTAMSEIQQAYLRMLDGLGLWDVQTARLVAVRKHEPQSDRDLVLVGTVDINQVTRQMLDLVAERSRLGLHPHQVELRGAVGPSGRVTALIGAPAEQAALFDSHGCLLSAAWSIAVMDVLEADIRVCEGPAEQAEQVAQELAGFGGRYRADEIVVGLSDERLGPFVERELQSHEVPTRWIEGIRLADSGPSRLLLALADVLEASRFEDFAAFVRHVDLASVDLSAFDAAFREHLPLGLDELESLVRTSRRTYAEPVRRGLQAVRELLAPWRCSAKRINEWGEPLIVWLRAVYGDRVLEELTSEGRSWPLALSELNAAAQELATIPESIAPVVSAADAIRCVVQQLSKKFVPPDTDASAIELLGWLELALDDSPAAIVTSFNEGFVPTSLNSDLFLPNELRRRLGLTDNARRFARDAYAVTVLRHSRRDVRWLVARRDPTGRPLVPSRLLFATAPDDLPGRVLRLMEPERKEANSCEPEGVRARTIELVRARSSSGSPGEVPRPARIVEMIGGTELSQPTRELTLNVTEFRTFLACRYRYFLKHVVKLRSIDDDAVELDGLAFGNVLHEVLRRFGMSTKKDLSDSDKLQRVLRKTLAEVADEQFGTRRRAVVSVQLKQLESRLDAFAVWQAKWRCEGWVIEHVERAIRPEDQIIDPASGSRTQPTMSLTDSIGGDEFRISVWLHGRVDRLDRNEQTGEWALFDYKSGDRGDEPEKTHRKRNGEWVDLQLPLYRHLVRELALPREPKLGYINLPKELTEVGVRFANWSAADLASADDTAANVARQIAACDFWPPADPPPRLIREFDDLCQVGVFGG